MKSNSLDKSESLKRLFDECYEASQEATETNIRSWIDEEKIIPSWLSKESYAYFDNEFHSLLKTFCNAVSSMRKYSYTPEETNPPNIKCFEGTIYESIYTKLYSIGYDSYEFELLKLKTIVHIFSDSETIKPILRQLERKSANAVVSMMENYFAECKLWTFYVISKPYREDKREILAKVIKHVNIISDLLEGTLTDYDVGYSATQVASLTSRILRHKPQSAENNLNEYRQTIVNLLSPLRNENHSAADFLKEFSKNLERELSRTDDPKKAPAMKPRKVNYSKADRVFQVKVMASEIEKIFGKKHYRIVSEIMQVFRPEDEDALEESHIRKIVTGKN